MALEHLVLHWHLEASVGIQLFQSVINSFEAIIFTYGSVKMYFAAMQKWAILSCLMLKSNPIQRHDSQHSKSTKEKVNWLQ